MNTKYFRFGLAVVTASALILSACTSESSSTTNDTTSVTEAAGEHGDFAFGEPADPADATRTIEMVAKDSLQFDPDTIDVSVGDIITFRVTNEGNLTHDFTLGDEATQKEHEKEMAEHPGMDMADEANGMILPPGETKELTWHFTEAGPLLIGCHEPGHYAAGMKAQVTVSS